MKYANLHLHSIYSDGVLTPLELCTIAKEQGFFALSLTDHNTAAGWKAFKKAAEKTGMDYILGTECNINDDGRDFHIVAYDFDPTANDINEYITRYEQYMYEVTKAKFHGLVKQKLIPAITWQNVLEDTTSEGYICNEQVFASLVKRTDMTQADYWEYSAMFRKQKHDVKKDLPVKTAKDLIKRIVDAGGVASLAHPHEQTQYLPELYGYGLRCVEYDHPDIDKKDAALALEFASVHEDMYLAGGTDHTGFLSNHAVERGLFEGFESSGFLTPLYEDVRNGVTKDEFSALKNRIKG